MSGDAFAILPGALDAALRAGRAMQALGELVPAAFISQTGLTGAQDGLSAQSGTETSACCR